jgi:hypothetical protein
MDCAGPEQAGGCCYISTTGNCTSHLHHCCGIWGECTVSACMSVGPALLQCEQLLRL